MPDNQKFSENPNTFLCRRWSHSALAWASLEKGRRIEWWKNTPRIFILWYVLRVSKGNERQWYENWPLEWSVLISILGLFALFWLTFMCFHLFWLAFTCFHLFWLALTSYKWRQFVCACSVNVSLDTATKRVRMLDRFRSFKELLVIPAWVEFDEERTEHRSTLFGTDIDVIQLENFLIEFVLMEKSEGWIELL